MAEDSDWIDSTSELTVVFRLTEMVFFCAVPNNQAANNVGRDQRGQITSIVPWPVQVLQPNSEARSPHSMALLCILLATFRRDDCGAGSLYQNMICVTSVDDIGIGLPS